MYRLLKTLFLLPWLSACAPTWPDGGISGDWSGGLRPGANPDFNWRLSGDRQVAPLQVFDDGRQTWLQFAPGQTVPAIFIEQGGVERPAPYARREPYIVLQGKWPALVMRGGSLRARADYLGAAGLAAPMGRPETTPMEPAATSSATAAVASSTAGAAALPPSSAQMMQAVPQAVSGRMAPPAQPAPTPAANGTAAAQAMGSYRVGPADENMRRALARWASIAGWTFQPEHWAVDVDIPLSGSADFSDDFKQSVRDLLGATELGERPLQPCFYANRVVRVVPMSQACDRTAASPGAGA